VTIVSDTTSVKKRKEAAENFVWRPPPSLVGPRPRMRPGVSSGGALSYSPYDEAADAEAKCRIQQQKSSARKLNEGRKIFEKTHVLAQLREELGMSRRELFGDANNRAGGKKKNRILNKFGDYKMLWKMIGNMRIRMEEEEGRVDEESLGYAISEILKDWSEEGADVSLSNYGRPMTEGGGMDRYRVKLEFLARGEVGVYPDDPDDRRTNYKQFPVTPVRSRPSSAAGYRVMTEPGGALKALDHAGIGPLQDMGKVMYPLEMEDTHLDVVYQKWQRCYWEERW